MFIRKESKLCLIIIMRISIIIPTFNNLEYLKLVLKSINNNSKYLHEIIVHVNEGSDGTYDYVKKNSIKHSYSSKNIGLCSAVNNAAALSTSNYIMYTHDDMFFCKNWDVFLKKKIEDQKSNFFYLSGKTISDNDINNDFKCGLSHDTFDSGLFDKFCKATVSPDLQGSHWAPHLIHKDVWNKVGGFSEEFNPGDGSDPDLCLKLWNVGVRIFMCIGDFKVYHFESVTIRKSTVVKNNGTKKFLLKWGFNPRFFRKYYLRGESRDIYNGPLNEPNFTLNMLGDLLINKLKFFYYKIFNAK